MSTSEYGSLIRRAIILHHTKCVTSDKVQQAERDKKHNCKHPQGTVISVDEVWYHVLKNPEVITNLNYVMIQTTSLESITGKSLQNPENSTYTNFTQSDANATNNSEKVVRCPNEFRQLLSTNRHFTEQQSATHEDIKLYKTSFKLDIIARFSLRPPELMTIVDMVGKYYR